MNPQRIRPGPKFALICEIFVMYSACRIECILPLLLDLVDVDVQNKFSQRQGGSIIRLTISFLLAKTRSDMGVSESLLSRGVLFCVFPYD